MDETDSQLVASTDELVWAILLVVAVALTVALVVWLSRRSGQVGQRHDRQTA